MQNFDVSFNLDSIESKISVTYNPNTKQVNAELTFDQLTELYRRLPLHIEYEIHELPPSMHLLIVMAECMKHARENYLSTENAQDMILWQAHKNFYSTLFPILDALADLESMVNRYNDKKISDLSSRVKSFIEKFEAVIEKLLEKSSVSENKFFPKNQQENYRKYVNGFEQSIKKEVQAFWETLQQKDFNFLVSNYTTHAEFRPLGLLIIHLVEHVCRFLSAYKSLYASHPFSYLIEKPHDLQKIDELLEVKLAFLRSLAGINFTSAVPISDETIKILRIAGGKTIGDEEKYSVSLNQFIKPSHVADLNSWQVLFCSIADKFTEIEGYASIVEGVFFISAMIIAAILEVVAIVALRYSAAILVGFLSGLANLFLDIGIFFQVKHLSKIKQNIITVTDATDSALQSAHEYLSTRVGLAAIKNKRDIFHRQRYLSKLLEKNIEASHSKLLIEITKNSQSSLAILAQRVISATLLRERIEQGYQAVAQDLYNIIAGNPGYLTTKLQYSEAKILVALIGRLRKEKLAEDIVGKLSALSDIPYEVQMQSPMHDRNNTLPDYKSLDLGRVPSSPVFQPNQISPPESIMVFVEILILEFCVLINGIFVKLPLASTAALLVALIAFAQTYLSIDGFLPFLVNELSHSFTGEGAVTDMRIMLASFLLWKISTLAFETGLVMYKHDLHFMDKLYGDPTNAFLIFTSLTGVGIATRFAPLLPHSFDAFGAGMANIIFFIFPDMIKKFVNASFNTYFSFANAVIEESRIAWEGQMPFPLIEYFFIGLKTLFLFSVLAAGFYVPNLSRSEHKIKEVAEEIKSVGSGKNKRLAANFIVRLYDAYGLKMDRVHAKIVYDLLSRANENHCFLKNFYDQSIYQGSSNILQMLSLIPGIFITYPYRITLFIFAYLIDSPTIMMSVKKEFCADVTMATQFIAALIENFRSFMLAINQLVKSMVAFPVAILSICGYVDARKFNDQYLSRIDMHNNLHLLLQPCDLAYQKIVAMVTGKQPEINISVAYGLYGHFAGTNTNRHHADKDNKDVKITNHVHDEYIAYTA